jgi:heptosyltransferase-2
MRGIPRKYLVVGPSWVGDMVMAQSLYRLLHAQNADCTIDVVAPAWSLPILARMTEVRRAVELPVAHGEVALGTRIRCGRSLKAERYTHAIVLPRSWKAALVPFFAAVPVRTGYRGEWRYGLVNDMRTFDKERLPRTVQRFAALGLARDEPLPEELPQPRLRIDRDSQRRTLERLALADMGHAVALLPGAEYGPAKQWPLEYFTDLAARLAGVGLAVWVLGSQKERSLGDQICSAAAGDRVVNLCGRTTLAEVVDVLAACRVAVSNDSGLLHVAAAVGAHVVALYGSSSPAMTPPLTSQQHLFYLGLDCSPCFERVCPLGHLRCLREISVDAVCSVVVTQLGSPIVAADAEVRS